MSTNWPANSPLRWGTDEQDLKTSCKIWVHTLELHVHNVFIRPLSVCRALLRDKGQQIDLENVSTALHGVISERFQHVAETGGRSRNGRGRQSICLDVVMVEPGVELSHGTKRSRSPGLSKESIGKGVNSGGNSLDCPPPDLIPGANIATTPPQISSVFTKPPRKVIQLNESIYEVRKPTGTVNMEILFFHGLQFKGFSDTHFWSTWESRDGSCVWPEKWLANDFPGAKVMFVSYDGALTERKSHSSDLYLIIENLIQDIIMAGAIGQRPNCPLILVGHCFGGLIIKQLCLSVRRMEASTEFEAEKFRLRTFLDNLQGIFYYDTPHRGIPSLDNATYVKHDPLSAYFRTQSKDIARLNEEFSELCTKYQWHIHGLGASLKTRLSLFQDIIVVPEASGREGVFFNVAEKTNHFTVCKPTDKTSRSFYAFKYLLDKISAEREMVFHFHECHGIPEHCPGLDKHTFRVQEMLTSASIVGIVGMGGLGKTTISKSVFNCISREFEYACFLENVKTVPGFDLERWILSHFHHNGVKVDEKVTSWSVLKKKKTLMVFDDVDSEGQLKNLPHLDHFGKGTRLIITSRDQGILTRFENYNVYDVEFLGDDEARELLCYYVFGKEGLPKNLNIDMERSIGGVVKKCQGLPLTLEVIGCYLRGYHNRPDFWEQTIGQLGEAQGIDGGKEDKVWASLKVSFEALQSKEQEMFIEAATYFYGRPVDRALFAWSGADGRADMTWKNLLNRSMVKESFEDSPSSGRKTVWVHEHLRDLAKNVKEVHIISAFGADEVAKAVDLLNEDGVNRETSMVRLEKGFRRHSRLKVESLEKLEKLKYLEVDGVEPIGTWTSLPRTLSVLRWTRFGGWIVYTGSSWKPPENGYVPINLEGMNNLAILDLESWTVSKQFPKTLGNLDKMRILGLTDLQGSGCSAIDLGKLSRLKQLKLEDLSELKELGDSFDNLLALQILDITRCYRLERLPANFGGLSALENLSFTNCGFRELPDSFGHLSALKELLIWGCNNIKALPDSFTRLPSLQVLSIRSCYKLKRLPEAFGELDTLRELKIYLDCEVLPNSLGKLSLLEKLTIFSEQLQSLPETLGGLQSLRKLRLSQVQSLRNLPKEIGKLSSLQHLRIHYAEVLESLPEFENVSSLRRVRLLQLPNLKCLPNSLWHHRSLIELEVDPRLSALMVDSELSTTGVNIARISP